MQNINVNNDDCEENLVNQLSIKKNNNQQHGKKYSNPYLTRWLECKLKRRFRTEDYVEYRKEADVSKCLIKSCKRVLSGRSTGNVKRHYHRVHNFIILHGKVQTFIDSEDLSCSTDQNSHINVNLDTFFTYDPTVNKSLCKVPGCNATFDGKSPINMRHYCLKHNYKIECNNWNELNNLKLNSSDIPLNELATYDIRNSCYHCLFVNCDHILENNLATIEKHYYDVHLIIFSNSMGNTLYSVFKKRLQNRRIHENNIESDEFSDQQSGNTMDSCSSQISPFSEDEQAHCSNTSESNSKMQSKRLKWKKGQIEFFLKSYVEHCKKTNVSKCLIKNCRRLLKGLLPHNVKRHYQQMHDMVISCFFKDYDLRDLSDIVIGNFASYNVAAASYQCLFVNCNCNLEMGIDRIDKHYKEKHEIVIINRISKVRGYKEAFFEDENGPNCSKMLQKTPESPCSVLKQVHFVASNFVDYNEEENISKCLIKSCKWTMKYFEDEETIKDHYQKVHNINTGIHMYSNECGEQNCIKIGDFVIYDKETSSNMCLFRNCNQVLENYLPAIKNHYFERHAAIIGESLTGNLNRKRKYNELDEIDVSDNYVSAVANEFLSEDEQPLLCKKRKNLILPDSLSETELHSIKTECIHENENLSSSTNFEIVYQSEETTASQHNLIEKSKSLHMTLTKLMFLKSCFGLVIHQDLRLDLFNDDVFFKHLLSPYEQIIDFHINSSLLLDLILKGTDIVVRSLKETFSNKIVCLELYVVGHEKKYFFNINVRCQDGQCIRNYLIGLAPIDRAGTGIKSITDCLNKFNIDRQQVYMTTILADLQDDEEMIEILNDICEHNPEIQKHPICYIQLLLRCFVQKYSEDIKEWQILINSECEANTNVFNNLKELQKSMENLSQTDVELKPKLIQEPILFLKAFNILRNLMDKFNEEQYVIGDFYRDLLCCELELKGELKKNNNTYAGKLCEELSECKNTLLQSSELMAALYLDARFNFLGSRLLSESQKIKGKVYLLSLWERFGKYLQSTNSQADPLLVTEDSNEEFNDDDEYALLNQHINDITPVKSNACIEDLIINCVPAKREPFSLDILKYWHRKRQGIEDLIELTKIALTYSSSQYMLIYLQKNFTFCRNDTDKIDKFLLKHNQSILHKNINEIL